MSAHRSWIMPAGLALLFGGLLFCEAMRPLRPVTRPKGRRILRNLTVGAVGAAVAGPLVSLLVNPLMPFVQRKRLGLIPRLPAPPAVRDAAAIVLLDYSMYHWHRLNHRNAVLWRFHNAHHVDLDLDVSTAARFHFGELAFSVLVQAVQLAIIGPSPRAWFLHQALTACAVQFHHSNVRLPARLEHHLRWLFVTPRMHNIHHSIVKSETDSNYSTIVSLWDYLHGTMKWGIPTEAIEIGVPSYRAPQELTLLRILLMPFRQQRSWQLPNGRIPARGCPDR